VLFLTGQAISTQGLWIEKIAMSWLAWSLTGSAFWTGLIAALHFAPAFILGPILGVISDRVDSRHAFFALRHRNCRARDVGIEAGFCRGRL
jgi:MFS family permease